MSLPFTFTEIEGNFVGMIQHFHSHVCRHHKEIQKSALEYMEPWLSADDKRLRPQVKLMVKYMLGVPVKGLNKDLQKLADQYMKACDNWAANAAMKRRRRRAALLREAKHLGYRVEKRS